MKQKIADILSTILSRKHDAKITIKFEDKEGSVNGDGDTSRIIKEE